jgi:hypothetical protein
MAGKTLDIHDFIMPDMLGCAIARNYQDWSMRRQVKETAWKEVREYVYATDTTQTSNSTLPWKNKTTLPKLCQIRDNLYANYMATMFPKRKWLNWDANDEQSNGKEKREAVLNYMTNVIEQPQFKEEISKCILDYIDYGNTIATVEWVDETQELEGRTQVGYVGPLPRRISPLDIVFNPVATSFTNTPKIVRSLLTFGEVKKMLNQITTDQNREALEGMWQYLMDYRSNVFAHSGSVKVKDDYLQMDGFDSFSAYLGSNYMEVLTFYGDLYDVERDELLENYIITVVDRHKIVDKRPNPSFLGTAPIYHVGWRVRQDNLWAMGPLDNLVGMQYRLDHIENLKADLFDLIAFPPLKIKGYVEDFTWGPMAKIYTSDEGDVEMLSPDVQALNANVEIQQLQTQMEELAGAPKEALGIRSPGEKTAYEVQRLENAASRVFQSKIAQFEELFLEPLLNAMLELARRTITSAQVRVFDDELKFNTFMQLSSEDLAGNGRIRPLGARHFAEQSQMIQNLNAFYGSVVGSDPEIKAHFSTVKTAQMFEDLLNIADYEIVQPYVRLTEQQDAQRMTQTGQEQVAMEAQTPAGLAEDDVDL